MPPKKVAALIPALNEGPRIGKIVNQLQAIPLITQIVVANNGSIDDTREEGIKAGAIVVDENRKGYGAACLAGLRVIDDSVDAVLFVNADGAEVIEESALLLACLDDYDLVIGSRALGRQEKGAVLPQQKMGNYLACSLLYLIWNRHFTDLGPFRVIRYPILKKFKMRDKDYGWIIEMQIKALRLGARIIEVPVRTNRSVEPSKISGTLIGILGASYKILGAIFLYAFLDIITTINFNPVRDLFHKKPKNLPEKK